MGAGLDPLGAALGHYRTGPVRPSPTRPRATPSPDSDPPSNGRRASPKLVRTTLLATVAAAPVALAVRAFRGTASSPKTMGRVLVHLAMLSTASGWQLPQSTAPEETITGEAHGGVDRRRLADTPPPLPPLATNVACLPYKSNEALLDFSGAKPQRFLHCAHPPPSAERARIVPVPQGRTCCTTTWAALLVPTVRIRRLTALMTAAR